MVTLANPFNTDEVVGIAPASSVAEIKSALSGAGFENEILEGPYNSDAVDVAGNGIADAIVRFFQQGEEQDALREFRSALNNGDAVVRVSDVGDRAETAGKILVDHGGETIWHYGKWTYQKLHD